MIIHKSVCLEVPKSQAALRVVGINLSVCKNIHHTRNSNTWRRDLDADSKQMGQNGGSWRDSPGTDKPGGSWLARWDNRRRMFFSFVGRRFPPTNLS
ncbi:hypothetical protein DPMN_088424 [Dreissena polymorpha]|uniref:Uncharacterized protein n=1 Tax=Dreissena polymorpha TaxID=45954 RepID=A0A9D4KUU0_DREPO|nr:hypothetical protein DPMN_088424 [Dreissena polymorpha]